ncbi:MAG TPA: type II toxin-antitoxin system VapC family toxin [Dongiaceae bacterium]|nr:type II toxin-antitoxin system VapC family toxin [Dongiaceae bacterium]
MAVLIDSSVLLDMLYRDPVWGAASKAAVEEAIDAGEVVLNALVVAEIAPSFDDLPELMDRLPPDIYRRDPIPEEAAFLAGRVHAEYRRRGGRRTRTLPDFFIGAHCAVRGFALLTRDPRRIRRYFPTVTLVTP